MKRFTRLSIRKQFKLILCGLLTVGLLVAGLSYAAIDNLLTKNSAAYAQNTVERFNGEIAYLFKRVDTIFTNLLFDPNIEELMHSPYSAATPAYIKNLQVQFSSYSIMNRDIADIALFTPNMSWSGYFDAATLNTLALQLEGTKGTMNFGLMQSPLTAQKAPGDLRLVFGHNVYGMHDNTLYGKMLGSVFLSLDLSKSSITLPSDDRSSTYFILYDTTGKAVPFNCGTEQWEDILAQSNHLADRLTGDTAIYETTDYLIYATPVEETGLYMLSALDRHVLKQEVLQATALTLCATVVALTLFALIMRIMLHSMVTPLSQLSAYMQRIKTADPSAKKEPPVIDSCQEILSLNQSFATLLSEQAQLTARLQEATVTLYEEKLGKKQAELDFLRSQINPHFLYNALESIRDTADARNVPEISEATDALSKLFRYNIRGSAMAPFEQELEITKAYLTIQKMRFPNKLNVIESIRSETRGVPVMKLLLQPLVENAVYHGIEPKSGSGTLYIGAKMDENVLVVSVYDDGVGIAPEILCGLQACLRDPFAADIPEETHIGLLNVARRIRLQYGPNYGMTIESDLDGGTKVTLRVPAPGEEKKLC